MQWIYALELAALILCAYRLERAISRIGEELYRLRGGNPEADKIDQHGPPEQVDIAGN